ncbi:MAG TPA: hypothetical protein VIL34_01820 [Actinopolymorphaceae bacterium]|jgi:hypothetical protein
MTTPSEQQPQPPHQPPPYPGYPGQQPGHQAYASQQPGQQGHPGQQPGYPGQQYPAQPYAGQQYAGQQYGGYGPAPQAGQQPYSGQAMGGTQTPYAAQPPYAGQPAYPPQQAYPGQQPSLLGQQMPPDGDNRRNALPWVIAAVAGVVVVVGVAITLVLTLGGGESDTTAGDGGRNEGGRGSAVSDPPKGGELNQSSPEAAATAFISAVQAGDTDTLWELSCAAHEDCVAMVGGDLTPEQLEEVRNGLADLVNAKRFQDAAVVESRPAEYPGGTAVYYRSPLMCEEEKHALVFVKSGSSWYYLGPEGAAPIDAENCLGPN